MDRVTLQLVTIVGEAVLEERLCAEILASGGGGYTVTPAYGTGSRGKRAPGVGDGNVRIEAVMRPDAADQLLERLRDRYFPVYAVVAWVAPVGVVRGEKYV